MKLIEGSFDNPEVNNLLEKHFKELRSVSPEGSAHVLDIPGLKVNSIKFWSLWENNNLVGCGALKFLDIDHGEFKSIRIHDDFRNMGRAGFTGESSQMNAFKVPQLYNTADYATYFHGSSKYSLEEVLNYKLSAVSENENVSQLSPSFTPVSLTAEEKANLLDFLENGLYDPNLATKHTPAFILSGNCYPNNDQFSISSRNSKTNNAIF